MYAGCLPSATLDMIVLLKPKIFFKILLLNFAEKIRFIETDLFLELYLIHVKI